MLILSPQKVYIFTQVAEVPIEQRVWGRVIDTAHIEHFHEVPIAEYDAWQKEMEELNNLNSYEGNI